MRGTLQCRPKRHQPTGIIPAYAGNTKKAALTSPPHWDHPRVCGEHIHMHVAWCNTWGSSPRMRGTPPRVQCRFLPAEDHPRVCGEHSARQNCQWIKGGSSPRMRGTQTLVHRSEQGRGIIPAYAGNTSSSFRPYEYEKDHPRVCGEHIGRTEGVASVIGSSPRMRGTLASTLTALPCLGIIPAYAGNTFAGVERLFDGWDHPRVCGEHTLDTIGWGSG